MRHRNHAEKLILYLASNCRGRERGLRAKELSKIIFGDNSDRNQRNLRELVQGLRNRGYPICASPVYGYWWPVDELEIEISCHNLRSHAMASLRQESALRKRGVSHINGQGDLGLVAGPVQVDLNSERFIGPSRAPAVLEIPDSLLAELRQQAEKQGVSLADLVVAKLRS